MKRLYNDPEVGTVLFQKKAANKNYVIRIKSGEVRVSLPLSGSYQKALDFFLSRKTSILPSLDRQKENLQVLPFEEKARLWKEAHLYLPGRLAQLAKEHGFHYQNAKISQSKSRWGSCSSKKSINLSYHLMALPRHLIDYVLLHELCHTIHMNHGPLFWSLLNQLTDDQAETLRKELKNHHIATG